MNNNIDKGKGCKHDYIGFYDNNIENSISETASIGLYFVDERIEINHETGGSETDFVINKENTRKLYIAMKMFFEKDLIEYNEEEE